ncbi:DUF2116 family Zn-ribbon domain-containing protein [[Eubacterium] cellulosolvens]
MGVIKHKHCGICGISIPSHKTFCSRECEDKENKMSKRRKYTFIFTLLLFPIIMFLMLLFSSIR